MTMKSNFDTHGDGEDMDSDVVATNFSDDNSGYQINDLLYIENIDILIFLLVFKILKLMYNNVWMILFFLR